MNTLLAILVSACLVLFPAGALAGQDEQQKLDHWMEKTMEDYGIPGMALVVTREDRIVYARAAGSGEPGRSFSVNTQVPLGELSQTLTALAAARLMEDGLLDPDDPVRSHIGHFRTGNLAHSEALTLGDLLEHRSGLDPRDYRNELLPDRSISAGVVDLRRMMPREEPGGSFRMFHPNYNVVGLLVETVRDEPYGDALRHLVLEPLGMRSTGGERSRLVSGHGSVFGWPRQRDTSFVRYDLPSTGMVSTASDLGRFLLYLHSGVQAGRPSLQDEDSVPEAAVLLSDREVLWEPVTGRQDDLGLGWYVREDPDGRLRVWRYGNTDNHHVQMVFYPEEQLGVALVANVNHVVHRTLVYPRLSGQVVTLLEDGEPPGRPWTGYAHRGLLFLGIGLAIRQIYRMRRLPAYVAEFRYIGKGPLYLSMLRDLLVPAVLLVVLPRLVRFAFQLQLTYGDFFREAPDVVLLLAVVSGLAVLNVLLKLILLLHRPRNPYRVGR